MPNDRKTDDDLTLKAKKRDKKINITEIAIKKIPRIEYKGLTSEENEILYYLAGFVLWTSFDENDSDEVAVTCALDLEDPLAELGIAYGDEHEVDICADTTSFHLISSGNKCVVVVHNHPSTQTLSLEDIRLFLHYASIRYIVVVTNQGNIHYLRKDDDYSYEAARELFVECIEGLSEKSSVKEIYTAGLSFLARCSEVGLYYR